MGPDSWSLDTLKGYNLTLSITEVHDETPLPLREDTRNGVDNRKYHEDDNDASDEKTEGMGEEKKEDVNDGKNGHETAILAGGISHTDSSQL